MLLNRIYNALKSLNLTIVLLVLIALIVSVSSLESVYPQFLKSIGLYNVYYSLYFKIIIALFIINLILCTISLIPKTKKLFQVPEKAQKIFKFRDSANIKKSHFKALLKQKKLFFYEKNEIILVHKNPIRKIIVYFIHFAVLIIALGAAISSFFGFRGMMVLYNGRPTNSVYLINSHHVMNLPYLIVSNNFHIKYYKKGSVPKEYKTEGFIIDGKKKIPFSIMVNHPFKYKGVWLYQSSYIPRKSETFVKLKVNNSNDDFYLRKPKRKENLAIYLKKLDFYNSRFIANLYIFTQKGYADGWIYQGQSVSVAGNRITFLKAHETFISLISASKDSGSSIILIGFVLLAISSFFIILPYKRKSFKIT